MLDGDERERYRLIETVGAAKLWSTALFSSEFSPAFQPEEKTRGFSSTDPLILAHATDHQVIRHRRTAFRQKTYALQPFYNITTLKGP